MVINFRGHHLVNLFDHIKKGKPEPPFDESEDYLRYEEILSHSHIKIVAGLDYICLKCSGSDKKENICKRFSNRFSNDNLINVDKKIAEQAGLQIGEIYSSTFLRKHLMKLKELGACQEYSGKSLIEIRYRK